MNILSSTAWISICFCILSTVLTPNTLFKVLVYFFISALIGYTADTLIIFALFLDTAEIERHKWEDFSIEENTQYHQFMLMYDIYNGREYSFMDQVKRKLLLIEEFHLRTD